MGHGGRRPATLAVAIGLIGLLATAGCGGPRMVSQGQGAPRPVLAAAKFLDRLTPYGRWIEHSDYGEVWTPFDTLGDWRPYFHGRWVYTGAGWTWISLEPWGWITEHYGRWDQDMLYGWIWVPGDVWAPAWVTWRANEAWIGWAPLRPGAELRPSGEFVITQRPVDDAWSFVDWPNFLAPEIHLRVGRQDENPEFVDRTRELASVVMRDGQPVNLEPEVDRVERGAETIVERRRLVDRTSPVDGLAAVRGNVVEVYRPRIEGDLQPGAPTGGTATER